MVQETPPSTRYAYIDLGANNGGTLKSFMNPGPGDLNYTLPEGIEPSMFEAFLFEGNPVFNRDLISVKTKYSRRTPPIHVNIYPEHVIWTKSEIVEFHLDTVNQHDSYWGSSMYKFHRDVETSEKKGKGVDHRAYGVDLSNFLMTEFTEDDYVVVKMDIEGSEFDILPDLYYKQAHHLIDLFYVEEHKWMLPKFDEGTEMKYTQAFNSIKEDGVDIRNMHTAT